MIEFLSLLLNKEMSVEQREETLQTDYHLQMTEELREEVNDVCNYSDAMLRMGEQQGLQKGLQQGQIKGAVRIYREDMELDDETIIEKIMKKFGLSRKDAQGYVEPEPAKA